MKKILFICVLHLNLLGYSQNLTVKPRLNFSQNERQLESPYTTQNNSNQTLPYPIIFIHGLNSNSDVWLDLSTQMINSGLSIGGRFDFCLNDNGNNNTANKLIYPTPNADIALYTNYITEITAADIYLLNFDVDNFGRLRSNSNFTDVLSNEAAIVKQGIAIKLAIQIVLQKTGRDKVILMGHSMGGLASREYIQNPINWQSDGNHHVAKLVTTGTPHGGYTGTNAGLITGIESRSEAYRDLRKEFTLSGSNGTYLYGGIENTSNISNSIFSAFYNVDVNCNGINGDNTLIVGLNQKSLPLTLDYAYIIGKCTNCSLLQGDIEGDGIVRSVNANLNNFYILPLPSNEFTHTADAIDFYIGLHSDLPKAIPVSFKGLDEPNEYNLSYEVNLNQTYKGFITQQPIGGYSSDFDDYKINILNTGNYTINVSNSYNNTISYRILNSSFNILVTNTILPNSLQTSFQHNLTSGIYYIEFISTGNSSSHLYPYSFIIQNNLSLEDNLLDLSIKAYPNPFSNQITIEANEPIYKVEIYNLLGQKVKNILYNSPTENSINIDLSNLSQGNYIAKVSSELLTDTIKLNKN